MTTAHQAMLPDVRSLNATAPDGRVVMPLSLRGAAATADGDLLRSSATGKLTDAENFGRHVAAELLDLGAAVASGTPLAPGPTNVGDGAPQWAATLDSMGPETRPSVRVDAEGAQVRYRSLRGRRLHDAGRLRAAARSVRDNTVAGLKLAGGRGAQAREAAESMTTHAVQASEAVSSRADEPADRQR